jgi:hypothetical protein
MGMPAMGMPSFFVNEKALLDEEGFKNSKAISHHLTEIRLPFIALRLVFG